MSYCSDLPKICEGRDLSSWQNSPPNHLNFGVLNRTSVGCLVFCLFTEPVRDVLKGEDGKWPENLGCCLKKLDICWEIWCAVRMYLSMSALFFMIILNFLSSLLSIVNMLQAYYCNMGTRKSDQDGNGNQNSRYHHTMWHTSLLKVPFFVISLSCKRVVESVLLL